MKAVTRVDWNAAPQTPRIANVGAARFEADILAAGRPAVLEGLVADWPLVRAARRSPEDALDKLLEFDDGRRIEAFEGPPEIRGRFFYNDAFDGFNFERRETSLSELAATLIRLSSDPNPISVYAGAIPIPAALPRLLLEVRSGLIPAEREQLISLWIGNRTRVAAHWDLPQNLICNVAGRRRYILLPPEELPNLYIGPLDFTLAGQPLSLVDFLAPDFERHPKFASAVARAEVANLEPGDALYLPSMWWHHAESLDPVGAMVNVWWRDGPAHLTTPLTTLAHAALTLRDLPERERAVWKMFFEHYIFGANGDPLAHLPPEQRGIMGQATPGTIARIKALLARSIS